MANRITNALKAVVRDYLSLNGFIETQPVIEADIRSGVSFKGTNMIILIMAIFIASLGLNTNSTAVIIGAMLISPLMGPIIGIGLGIGIMDYVLLRQSLRNLAMAALFSVATATIYFLISPVSEGHSELLARTQPTIYDVLIALFGGGAGIIGIASKSKGNVIPGVAIATALMPPLCTVGYGLATWQPHYFLGALYLFLINCVFITLSTFIGVKAMHFVSVKTNDPVRAGRIRKIVYAVAIAALLPSIYLTYNMLRQSRFNFNVQNFVANEMQFPDTRVIASNGAIVHGKRVIDVTLLGRILPADSLRMALTPRLAHYGLKGCELNILQGENALPAEKSLAANQSTASDIYTLSQKALNARQKTIDSLHAIVAAQNYRDTIGAAMAPELRVVFPEIADIAISRNVFCQVSNASLDTFEIAMVKYRSIPSQATVTKLREYLEARLGTRPVRIVDVSAESWN